jgi:hypothetical protein
MASEPCPASDTASDTEASAENPLSTLRPEEARVLQAVQLHAPALREADRSLVTSLLRKRLILTWVLDRREALGVQYALTPEGRRKLDAWTRHQRIRIAPDLERPHLPSKTFAGLPVQRAGKMDWLLPVATFTSVPALVVILGVFSPSSFLPWTGLPLAGVWLLTQQRRTVRRDFPQPKHLAATTQAVPDKPATIPVLFADLLVQIDAIQLPREDISSAHGYALRHLSEKAHEAVQAFCCIPTTTQAHAEAGQEVEAQLRLILARLTQAREAQAQAELERLKALRALIEA